MSSIAELALPGLLRENDESGALSDLVSVLVSSGDLFYEWDLVADPARTAVWLVLLLTAMTPLPVRLTRVTLRLTLARAVV